MVPARLNKLGSIFQMFKFYYRIQAHRLMQSNLLQNGVLSYLFLIGKREKHVTTKRRGRSGIIYHVHLPPQSIRIMVAERFQFRMHSTKQHRNSLRSSRARTHEGIANNDRMSHMTVPHRTGDGFGLVLTSPTYTGVEYRAASQR